MLAVAVVVVLTQLLVAVVLVAEEQVVEQMPLLQLLEQQIQAAVAVAVDKILRDLALRAVQELL
jgi:hypothetical protein